MMDDARSLHIITSRDDRKPAPYTYPDELKERAFIAWVDAGRNATKAHRLLVDLCSDPDADDSLPLPAELPDEMTIRRWVHRYDWRSKLTQAVADHFPAISARQAARLIMQTDKALDEWDAIMDGDRDHLPTSAMNARVALITTNLQLRGLGTAGAKGGEPTVAQSNRPAIDLTTLTPQELARYQRDQLRSGKEEQR